MTEGEDEICRQAEKLASGTATAVDGIAPLFLEDFYPGQTFKGLSRFHVSKEGIKAFALQFDPQPFHLDHEAAVDSIFRGLAASGWHTAAIMMKLLVESELNIAGGIVGGGFDELRWLLPVRPGDELSVQSEVLEVIRSKSKPHKGIIKVRTETLNQLDQVVQVAVANLIVSASVSR